MWQAKVLALVTAIFLSGGILTPTSALQVANNPWFGTILTDDFGRAVYVTSGNGKCIDECRLLWEPVPLEAVASTALELDTKRVGTTRGPFGEVQATFGGRPLFYFLEDFVAGDTNEQQFEEFGRVGFLVAPNGAPISDAIGDGCGCHNQIAQN